MKIFIPHFLKSLIPGYLCSDTINYKTSVFRTRSVSSIEDILLEQETLQGCLNLFIIVIVIRFVIVQRYYSYKTNYPNKSYLERYKSAGEIW